MTKPNAYCTYFDSGYLTRGRLLLESLRAQEDHSTFVVLALDDVARAGVEAWSDPSVEIVTLEMLESHFPELTEVRSTRTQMEYLFTLTPWLVRLVIEQNLYEWVTYLDADMYFFTSPTPIYQEIDTNSVAIVEHRFPAMQAWRRKYGRFNVGWVGFRNDRDGMECLRWWAGSCLAWCYDRVENGKFADQRYLDDFPQRFNRVAIISHIGADVAPWNLRSSHVDRDSSGQVTVDGVPIIFFHFHGLRAEEARFHFKHLPYLVKTTAVIRDHIYRPYCVRLHNLKKAHGTSAAIMPRAPTFAARFRAGRSVVLRHLGQWRGDYVDVS